MKSNKPVVKRFFDKNHNNYVTLVGAHLPEPHPTLDSEPKSSLWDFFKCFKIDLKNDDKESKMNLNNQ